MRIEHFCSCGNRIRGNRPAKLTCPACGQTVELEGYQMPRWVRLVYYLRKPEDKGVGDTIERCLGIWGQRFKKTLKRWGVDCGCSNRRDHYNRQFSYADLDPKE